MFRITGDPSSGSHVQCLAKNYKNDSIVSVDMNKVHVNGHNRTIFVILAKHYTRLPDDGSSVIRNMLEHFYKYFIILIVSTYYILCISWIIKCFITFRII